MSKEEKRKYLLLLNKNYKLKFQGIVFDHYKRKCNCCGESIPKFLSIDHVNNDGQYDRYKNGKNRIKGWSLYKKIIDEDFPKRFQVLCFNCNYGKRVNNGICPHKDI